MSAVKGKGVGYPFRGERQQQRQYKLRALLIQNTLEGPTQFRDQIPPPPTWPAAHTRREHDLALGHTQSLAGSSLIAASGGRPIMNPRAQVRRLKLRAITPLTPSTPSQP